MGTFTEYTDFSKNELLRHFTQNDELFLAFRYITWKCYQHNTTTLIASRINSTQPSTSENSTKNYSHSTFIFSGIIIHSFIRVFYCLQYIYRKSVSLQYSMQSYIFAGISSTMSVQCHPPKITKGVVQQSVSYSVISNKLWCSHGLK